MSADEKARLRRNRYEWQQASRALCDVKAALARRDETIALWKGLFCASCLCNAVLIAWVVWLYERGV